ncbi:hypothetical protein D3C86_1218210 [compost metagenome]
MSNVKFVGWDAGATQGEGGNHVNVYPELGNAIELQVIEEVFDAPAAEAIQLLEAVPVEYLLL